MDGKKARIDDYSQHKSGGGNYSKFQQNSAKDLHQLVYRLPSFLIIRKVEHYYLRLKIVF